MLLLGACFHERAVLSLGPLSVTNQALMLLGIYATGMLLAVLSILLLRKSLLRGAVTPLVMELPPYRCPSVRGLALHAWERGWMYLRKAGTVILLAVVVLWVLKTWPGLPPAERARLDTQRGGAAQVEDAQRERLAQIDKAEAREQLENLAIWWTVADWARFDAQRAAAWVMAECALRERFDAERSAARMEAECALPKQLAPIDAREAREHLENSAIGRAGRFVAPVLAPAGLDWKVATAMLGALAAKEVFIGQMGVIYAEGGDASGQAASGAASNPLRKDRPRLFAPPRPVHDAHDPDRLALPGHRRRHLARERPLAMGRPAVVLPGRPGLGGDDGDVPDQHSIGSWLTARGLDYPN